VGNFPIRNKTKHINLPLQAVFSQFPEHQSKVFPVKKFMKHQYLQQFNHQTIDNKMDTVSYRGNINKCYFQVGIG
jgi:hypothetical protein